MPEFESPPVTEVAVGVELSPLRWWGLPHFGLFWETIRPEFPRNRALPMLAPSVENFEEPAPPPADVINFAFAPDPAAVRCWFLDQTEANVVQVQRDRLIRNWRQISPDQAYPRYEAYIRPEFERAFATFARFAEENKDGVGPPLSALQVEVTYVNDFEPGREWAAGHPDLKGLFALWGGTTSTGFLPQPYGMRAGVSYQMPDGRGRLHVTVQRVSRQQDGAEVLQMRMVGRRRPDGADLTSVMAAADVCREWVVRGFEDLTAPTMHALWRRKP